MCCAFKAQLGVLWTGCLNCVSSVWLHPVGACLSPEPETLVLPFSNQRFNDENVVQVLLLRSLNALGELLLQLCVHETENLFRSM